ncbi:hypothetical protein ACJJTC_007087 [Scirpophaga incertulas]
MLSGLVKSYQSPILLSSWHSGFVDNFATTTRLFLRWNGYFYRIIRDETKLENIGVQTDAACGGDLLLPFLFDRDNNTLPRPAVAVILTYGGILALESSPASGQKENCGSHDINKERQQHGEFWTLYPLLRKDENNSVFYRHNFTRYTRPVVNICN